MGKMLLIGLGGFIGAVSRYVISGYIQEWTKSFYFPYGTLGVNLIGCLIIGLLSQLVETRQVLTPETRLFIFIGFLGAFTTFSTFSNETLNLLRDGETRLSFVNVGLHLLFGLSAVWLGRTLVYLVWR